jgi:hypothetical protein
MHEVNQAGYENLLLELLQGTPTVITDPHNFRPVPLQVIVDSAMMDDEDVSTRPADYGDFRGDPRAEIVQETDVDIAQLKF